MRSSHCLLVTVFILLSGAIGCATPPIHAVLVSDEKNVWVEDHENNGLLYCLSNSDGPRADPVCFSARKAFDYEKAHISRVRTPPASSITPASEPSVK